MNSPSRRPRVAVFFGGTSPNNDLSTETGQWVCQYLPRSQYDVVPVEVTPRGEWKVPLGSLPRSGSVATTLKRLGEAIPSLNPAQALQRLLAKPIDSLLTVVRGHGGDDGSLHSLGQLLGAGVVGSPHSTCHHTSDKHLFTQTIGDVARTPFTRKFSRRRPIDSITQEIQEDFLPPLFLKPASQEGSFGIERIESPDELTAAITRIAAFDDIIAQETIPGTEFSVSLVEDQRGRLHTLPATVVVPQRTLFFDQLAKRKPGRVALHTAPDTSNSIISEIQEIARDVYHELNCSGTVTIDLVATDDDVVVLEVNTVPTLSAFTPLLGQLKAAGMHPSILLGHMVAGSLERAS